ncbi:peptidoglycan-binding protein [Streptomyces sp. NPDC089919]|uniref:peptidoglycan-binding protein n=1 Tax=Streptomyces sp. NPDC089919 TaxID=3155188 RepID=UPI00344402A7
MTGTARGRRAVLGVLAGSALMTTGGLLATVFVKSPAQAAAEAAPPAQGDLLAAVERRVLADTVVLRGTVVAGQSVEVAPAPPGEGRAVVTRLPLAAGAPVRAGQVLAEVSGRPVFALPGALPAYRDLRPGATGADVGQLQRALAALGHRTGPDRAGVFGPGTGAALAAHYRALGYDPLPAVPDAAATLTAARTAVRDARWALEDAQDAARAPRPKGAAPAAVSREAARARETLAGARAALAGAEAAAGPMLPASEVVYVRSFPARVSRLAAAVGTPVTGPVLTLAAGDLLVETYLQEDRRRLLRAGLPVRISVEATGTEAPGRVGLVAADRTTGPLAGSGAAPGPDGAAGSGADPGGGAAGSGGTGPDLGYRMLVRPDRPLPAALAGQDVRLTVERAATAGPALVVPVTAVSAGADGRTSVTTVDPTGTHRRVPVRTGTTGDGYVEVVPLPPATLAAGARVVTGTTRSGTP